MSAQQVNSLLAHALKFLSYRARTKQEIERYLSKKSQDQSERDQVVQRLDELGLIDDADFANQLISARLKKGYGQKKIYFDLISKGIAKKTITSSLNQITAKQWQTSANIAFDKQATKFNKLNYQEKKTKIYRYLYARVFDGRVIRSLIDEIDALE